MWIAEATPAQLATVKRLVQNKQLEFIVGGWTMEDEACTTYSANIDQMTQGHSYISTLFGSDAVPRYGWQIDPFGHSSVAHRHFMEMGFKATVGCRIDYTLKAQMEKEQRLEFDWFPSASAPDRRIFTHILDRHVRTGSGVGGHFCLSLGPAHQPPSPRGIQGYPTAVWGLAWDTVSPPVTPANIAELGYRVVANARERREWFQTGHILFPWGNDFACVPRLHSLFRAINGTPT